MTASHDKARAERWARNNRLAAAQVGVVKALEEVQWVEHGRPVGWGEPEWGLWCPSCHHYKPDGHRPINVIPNLPACPISAALDELRDAEGKAPPMTEKETESEKRQGAADARRESLEEPFD